MTVPEVSDSVRTRLTARPPAMRGYPYVWLLLFLGFMVALRFIPAWGDDQKLLFNLWLIYTLMTIGFYFVFGLSGQFAFSQAAFAMVGGYCSLWAAREGATFLVAAAFGTLVACVIAFGFAWIARRANLFFLAIATLALGEIITQVITQWDEFTGARGGEVFSVKPIELFGWAVTTKGQSVAVNERNVFWVYLAAVAIALLLGTWMARSPVKREAIAMRDQATVASTVGVPTMRVRLTMFVLGSAMGAFAGALYVHANGYAQPADYSVELGLGIFVMLIVGGIDSLWGPVLGAAFYVWLPHILQRLDITVFGHQIRDYNQIIYGAALLLAMIFLPEGLVGISRRIQARLQGRAVGKDRRTWLSDLFGVTKPPVEREVVIPDVRLPALDVAAREQAVESGAHIEGTAILRATDIRVSFGGVRAVDGVSLDVRPGEVLGLVGPNGSGKTTFLNALTGVVPASGDLEIAGRKVELGTPGRARKVGMLRTYQAPQTYDHLSCIEDVLVSTADRTLTGTTASWFLRPAVVRHERERWRIANDALARVGLADVAETPARRLTYGQRRLLELARAIAGDPTVLLLDEPSAGLDAAETAQLSGYLRGLRDDGVSLLVIDHKLDFITQLCDRVAVLELGHLVAVGDAATVFQDQRVVDAYLGVAGAE